jgi:hypothetical protein
MLKVPAGTGSMPGGGGATTFGVSVAAAAGTDALGAGTALDGAAALWAFDGVRALGFAAGAAAGSTFAAGG